MIEFKIRGIIHKFICCYLRSAGGAFHHGEYGADGRYVVLMNEREYHGYAKFIEGQYDETY